MIGRLNISVEKNQVLNKPTPVYKPLKKIEQQYLWPFFAMFCLSLIVCPCVRTCRLFVCVFVHLYVCPLNLVAMAIEVLASVRPVVSGSLLMGLLFLFSSCLMLLCHYLSKPSHYVFSWGLFVDLKNLNTFSRLAMTASVNPQFDPRSR